MNKLKTTLVGLVAAVAMFALPASVFAAYSPANRATFTCNTPTDCPGAGYVTFNSFTNAPNFGDERAFFDSNASGSYSHAANVTDGQKITFRVYVHNNANPALIGDAAATAHNTKVQVMLAKGAFASQQASAQVSASNANPQFVTDTVSFNGARPFTLSFDTNQQVQVTYRPNGQGNYVTDKLPGVAFSDAQTMTSNVGDWKGCFNYAAIITLTATVSMPTPTTPTSTPTPTVQPAAATKAAALPNTGPGDVLGIFAGASGAGTAVHYAVSRRRRS